MRVIESLGEARNVVEQNEAYTSMTCTNCGNLKPKGQMKAEDRKNPKVYHCHKCGISVDRDVVNGARNIGLRYFMNL